MYRILLIVVAIIVYGSLYPWDFHSTQLAASPPWVLIEPRQRLTCPLNHSTDSRDCNSRAQHSACLSVQFRTLSAWSAKCRQRDSMK